MYRTQTFHLVQDKGIKSKGHNWGALRIKLEKAQDLIIMNSYTKHGWDLEAQVTLEEAPWYLSTYALPWVRGGDFNRTSEELISKGLYLNAYAHVPKGATSTCVVRGRLIDYFLTPLAEIGSVKECTKIVQTRTVSSSRPCVVKIGQKTALNKGASPSGCQKMARKTG